MVVPAIASGPTAWPRNIVLTTLYIVCTSIPKKAGMVNVNSIYLSGRYRGHYASGVGVAFYLESFMVVLVFNTVDYTAVTDFGFTASVSLFFVFPRRPPT